MSAQYTSEVVFGPTKEPSGWWAVGTRAASAALAVTFIIGASAERLSDEPTAAVNTAPVAIPQTVAKIALVYGPGRNALSFTPTGSRLAVIHGHGDNKYATTRQVGTSFADVHFKKNCQAYGDVVVKRSPSTIDFIPDTRLPETSLARDCEFAKMLGNTLLLPPSGLITVSGQEPYEYVAHFRDGIAETPLKHFR
jgi:hypothetical protein